MRGRNMILAILAGIALTGAALAGLGSAGAAAAPAGATAERASDGPKDNQQMPEPAPLPGTKLEVTAAQTDLMAAPPGMLHDMPARLHNTFGTAMHGAQLVLVAATESFYQVSLDCQEGKVRIQGWVDRKDVRPMAAVGP